MKRPVRADAIVIDKIAILPCGCAAKAFFRPYDMVLFEITQWAPLCPLGHRSSKAVELRGTDLVDDGRECNFE